MRLFAPVHFNVPFEDNSKAKTIGARFDWKSRSWYAPNRRVADGMSKHWVALSSPGDRTEISKILYFDTETDGIGGFRPPTQRLVQLAWQCGDQWGNDLINDVQDINPAVPHPHTVSDCRACGVAFEDAFARFNAALQECDLAVAHNLDFDWGVLRHELETRGMDACALDETMASKGYCTMKSTVQLCQMPKAKGTGFKWPRLEELYAHLTGEAPTVALHDALNDVRVLRTCVTLLGERELAGFVR